MFNYVRHLDIVTSAGFVIAVPIDLKLLYTGGPQLHHGIEDV